MWTRKDCGQIIRQGLLKPATSINSLSSFEVLNPELVICRMEPDVKLQIEFNINKGRGYVPAEENHLRGRVRCHRR